MPVSEVTSADVLEILTPLWHRKVATAKRVRQRLHAVLEWAVAMEYRTDCLRELTKIKAAWRELKCSTGKGVLIVSPSKLLISSKKGEI